MGNLKNMNLVLSTDAKPRLKWTTELHQLFVDAVDQLGGPDKATPKGLKRVMAIPGLTLFHLKSHLQKYRLGKSQQLQQTGNENKQEDNNEIQKCDDHQSRSIDDGNQAPINDSFKITQALQMQMEVQRKLYEQIEVQRHLQLRIEAQGKYLQSVLKRAEETLAGYSSSSLGIQFARAELSQLVSMVKTGCQSSSVSELTETGSPSLQETERKQLRSTVCSMQSSLTSSESSGRIQKLNKNDNFTYKDKSDNFTYKNNTASVELSLMDTHPQVKKRSGSTVSDGISVEKPLIKRSKNGFLGSFDLNSQYQNETELGSKTIDLNYKN